MTGEPNIYQRILAVASRIKSFEKDGKNTQFNFRYAGIEAIIERIQPICIENGIALVCEAYTDNTVLTFQGGKGENHISTCFVTLHAINVDNPEERVSVSMPGHGYDSLDKGIFKAISGARKYAIFGMFNLMAGDDDPERDEPTRKPATTPARIAPMQQEQWKEICGIGQDFGLTKQEFNKIVSDWHHVDDPRNMNIDQAQLTLEYMRKKYKTDGPDLAENPDFYGDDPPTSQPPTAPPDPDGYATDEDYYGKGKGKGKGNAKPKASSGGYISAKQIALIHVAMGKLKYYEKNDKEAFYNCINGILAKLHQERIISLSSCPKSTGKILIDHLMDITGMNK